MSHLTESVSPGLVSPLPASESRLVLALTSLLSWVKARSLFKFRPTAGDTEPPEPRRLGARPMMAAAWYGSLGPGPLCLPGHPALRFEPGYRD